MSGFCRAADPQEPIGDKKPQQVQILAPGYGELDFTAPQAGSYALPVLGAASDARVLNTEGEYVNFHTLFGNKYTLLSFIYSRCNDVNGCPLTHVVFSRVRQLARADPSLAGRVQFISMSFDPEHDTPAFLKSLAGNTHAHHHHHGQGDHGVADEAIEWIYLTADSKEHLQPVLDDYDQMVLNEIDERGDPTENFAHVLRVFLIDPDKNIRNIYSTSFLHPDIIINDIKTLIQHGGAAQRISQGRRDEGDGQRKADRAVRLGPGDYKGEYTAHYETDSLSLQTRQGKATDLMKVLEQQPLGLPELPTPEDNPLTAEKIALGKKLFFDRRLSLNNTISCAMCHIPEQGFSSNELKTPVGFEGRTVRRNAPTLYNVAYMQRLFHDARETSLEHQVWQPLLASNEMAMPSIGATIEKIKRLTDYQGLFERAFDGRQADMLTIGQAIAGYERTLVSADAPFDRWYFGKQKDAISARAKQGFRLFTGKARCVTCHTIEKEHALFTDNKLHNTGIGWYEAMRTTSADKKIQVAPGVFVPFRQALVDQVGHAPIGDLGLYEITQDPDDRWRYRTPGLRNLTLTAPYMHDGSLDTLEEVVAFYNHGGFANETLDPLIKPLGLSQDEQDALVTFLETLTGANVEELVMDAFTASVGDTSEADKPGMTPH